MNDMFHGYDMDRTMLRIGAMNMMTHGVENPFIEYRDSLSDQNPDKDMYSLILANPPFKGNLDTDTVSADLQKVCKTKKTELLFLTLFVRMLKIGGRCACIVPDGVLFGSSNAHKAIRKELKNLWRIRDLRQSSPCLPEYLSHTQEYQPESLSLPRPVTTEPMMCGFMI